MAMVAVRNSMEVTNQPFLDPWRCFVGNMKGLELEPLTVPLVQPFVPLVGLLSSWCGWPCSPRALFLLLRLELDINEGYFFFGQRVLLLRESQETRGLTANVNLKVFFVKCYAVVLCAALRVVSGCRPGPCRGWPFLGVGVPTLLCCCTPPFSSVFVIVCGDAGSDEGLSGSCVHVADEHARRYPRIKRVCRRKAMAMSWWPRCTAHRQLRRRRILVRTLADARKVFFL